MYWRSRLQVSVPCKTATDTDTSYAVYYVPYKGIWYCSGVTASSTVPTWDPSIVATEPTPAVTGTWYFVPLVLPAFFQQRAIAACLEFSYISKENDRSGTVSVHNNLPHRRLAVASATFDSLATITPEVMRTPELSFTTLWAPTETDDTRWVESAHIPGHSDIDATGILLVGRNMAAATRVNMASYTVSELLPNIAGTVVPSGFEPSRSTWQDVIFEFLRSPYLLSGISAAAMLHS